MKKVKSYFFTVAVIMSIIFPEALFPVYAAGIEEGCVVSEEDHNLDEQILQAKESFRQLVQERGIMATVYLTEEYSVKKGIEAGSATVASLPSGTLVFLQDVEICDTGVWYQVTFYQEDIECSGYIEGQYLAVGDERFLAWENTYADELYSEEQILVKAGNADINAFPQSYRTSLMQLKGQHPLWTFVVMNVDYRNLDWKYVIDMESSGNYSWVQGSYANKQTCPDAWKGVPADDNGWYLATREAVEYCVDPRNFLNEKYIFMFEQLTYNSEYHTPEAVQGIVQNSFMKGDIPGEGTTYTQTFYNVGRTIGVSPFHLACRVIQEQGMQGTSPLISGTYPGYESYYNYFNIKASGTDRETVIRSGLEYAKKNQWDTRVKSIAGGADFLSSNYIRRGQDTLYLQKFDVDNNANPCTHQYMQNITAPQTEGASIRSAYLKAGALDRPFVFKIPVYKNMPATPCPEPGTGNRVPDPAESDKTSPLWAFVVRLYKQALGRPDDGIMESEINDWYDKLKTKAQAGADVAYGFFFSQEFMDRQVTDEQFVDLLYSVMFDRSADPAGRENWLSVLKSGMRREYVFKGFTNSLEFKNVCGSYGVDPGEITSNSAGYQNVYRDMNEGVTGFVYRLYNKALERPGEEDGIEYWCKNLVQGVKTAEEAAHGFIFSQEFLNRNLNDEEFVEVMYQTFLDREPDVDGYMDWLGRLSAGADRLGVFHGFSASQEFRAIMEKYGVK